MIGCVLTVPSCYCWLAGPLKLNYPSALLLRECHIYLLLINYNSWNLCAKFYSKNQIICAKFLTKYPIWAPSGGTQTTFRPPLTMPDLCFLRWRSVPVNQKIFGHLLYLYLKERQNICVCLIFKYFFLPFYTLSVWPPLPLHWPCGESNQWRRNTSRATEIWLQGLK